MKINLIKNRHILLFVFALSFSSCTNQKSKTEPQPKRPNIIFILADDLGYGDIGVYGQKMIKTPNLDRMAKEGMVFTQHYAGSTVCAPSRSVLITGKHTGHTTIRGNAQHSTLLPTDTTLAELLKKAGYRTGLVGKWGLGENGTPGIPSKKGFDYFYGFLNQTHAHNHYPDYLWENEKHDSLDNKVELIPETYAKSIGGIAIERKTYAQDKFMEKTIRFIEQNKDSAFFLYLAFTLPHANNEAKYWNKSGMEVPDQGAYKDQSWPDAQKEHAAMISYLDKDVGIIMNKLKAFGLDENTLVIFTSDNGPHNEGGAHHEFFDSNGPLRGSKRDLFEGGIRVPFIARWPNTIKAETTTDHISAFWDVMPTLCDLTGIPEPVTTDGISFLPTLLGNSVQKKHEYLYWEFFEQGGKQAVRMENWKCIKLNVNKGDKSEILLFDLSKDIGEQDNLAGEHPDLINRAQLIMKEAHTYSSDFHFTDENPD
jgi:arylsulfatase A-like enzyme